MRSLLRTALPLVLLLSSTANAVEIEVGGRALEIPIPSGYAELTPEMSPTYEAMYAFVVPTNERHLILIPSEAAAAYLRGKDVELWRYMLVETERQTARFDITQSDFDEVRDTMRGQIDEMWEDARAQLPAAFDDASESVSEALDTDINVSIGEIIPMEAHLDTEDLFAFSQIINIGVAVEGEDLRSDVALATVALVKVRSKLILVMVYGGEDDLEWTREASTDWANQILAANPPLSGTTPDPTPDAILSSEDAVNTPEQREFDWNRVLIAALVGGVIGLFGFSVSRRRKGGN